MLVVKTEVRASPIHGLGLFAAEPLKKGQVVWCWHWGVDVEADVERSVPNAPPANVFALTYGWRVGDKMWIPLDDARYTNHSADPNLTVLPIPESSLFPPQMVSYTCRDIAAGEDLTEDYREFDPDFERYAHELTG